MTFPEKIWIERIEEYHTHYLGQNQDGLKFWAYPTFVWSMLPKDIVGDWKDFRKEYAILHIFDQQGAHVRTDYWYAGTTNQVDNHELDSKIEDWVNQLGEIEFCNIEVRLFKTIIDGVEFGLISDMESGFIDLQPHSTISFSEPWDGSYFT